MDGLLHDLRYAVRTLLRARAFSAVAILTLALGIGANTAIFSVVDAVLLRPLPYAEPDRLAVVWQRGDEGETTWLSPLEVLGYREGARTFAGFSAYTAGDANLTGGGEPERVASAQLLPGAFQLLGVPALLGRAFTPDDAARPGEVVVLSHALWRRRFGGDPAVVGSEIRVNGGARTVVGVMPPTFRLPLDYRERRPTELWTPLALDPDDLGDWGNRYLIGFGRLRPGVAPATATADLDRVLAGWVREGYLSDEGDRRLRRLAIPVSDLVLGDIRPALLVVFGAVGLVLLIACLNVANLMLARADRRRRELAVRTALGAPRRRVVGLLLTESLLLAGAGAALGAGLAWLGLELLIALRPAGIPRLDEVVLDARVLGFTALLGVLTGVVFGLAPALRLARSDLSSALREGTRSVAGSSRQTARRSLVVAEVAFSVVLVVAAGLLIRSFAELQRVRLGFDPGDVLTLQLSLPASDYPAPEDVVDLYRRAVDRVRELPSVRSAAAVRVLPLTGTIGDWSITLEGRPRVEGENPNGDWQVVTPGYFETMGIALARGRFLTDADDASAPLVVVVNETMADRYWPGQDPIGKRFRLGTLDQPWMSVVGITRPVRHNAVLEPPRAEMYIAHSQFAVEVGSAPRTMTLVLAAAGDPAAVLAGVRGAIRALDPALPVSEVRSMAAVASDAFARPRFTMLLLGLFATLALTLAAIGIYGVISLLVSQRTHEIGIRVALGAERRSILGLVVRQGMTLAGAGILLGLLGAASLTWIMRGLMYGVTPLDAPTFATVSLLLALVALAASFVPAARAARLDPAAALRRE